MTDLHKIRAAQVRAAEQAAIADLPPELLVGMEPKSPCAQPEHEGYGPAFPTNTTNEGNDGACYPNYGMSLRDYFAAKALVGATTRGWNPRLSMEEVARDCYLLADAMLKARTA